MVDFWLDQSARYLFLLPIYSVSLFAGVSSYVYGSEVPPPLGGVTSTLPSGRGRAWYEVPPPWGSPFNPPSWERWGYGCKVACFLITAFQGLSSCLPVFFFLLLICVLGARGCRFLTSQPQTSPPVESVYAAASASVVWSGSFQLKV